MNKAERTCAFQCELNNDLKYLKFQLQKEGHMVTLIDLKGYEILNGYGTTRAEALNDLLHNLIQVKLNFINNSIKMKNQNSKKIKSIKLKKMKKSIINLAAIIGLTITSQLASAQTGESNAEFIQESKQVLAKMIKKSPNLQSYYDQSYGYAVFPKVIKVGVSLGFGAGKGIVFKNDLTISKSKLKQLTFGLQFGAQKYTEVIFFQNEEALELFMNKKLKLDGQASAVALKSGASADLSYSYGVAVFTQTLGGLMFEASIGGQHFSIQPIED